MRKNAYLWKEVKALKNNLIFTLIIALTSIIIASRVGLHHHYIAYYLNAYIVISGVNYGFIKLLKSNLQIMLTVPYSLEKLIKHKTTAYLLTRSLIIMFITIATVVFSKINVCILISIPNIIQFSLFLLALWSWSLLVAILTLITGKNNIIIQLVKLGFLVTIYLLYKTPYSYLGFGLLILTTGLINKRIFNKVSSEILLMKG